VRVLSYINLAPQVEHTVTEEVMGVDLVQAQIKIAGGARLADIGLGDQAAVGAPNGYSIQCRVTTEDPTQNFQVGASGCTSCVADQRLCTRSCNSDAVL